jgi:two-component system chemotaxis response regulator CheY
MSIVMFVDDSEITLATTKIATARMPIQILQYLSAVEALEDLKTGKVNIDLLITDLNMPVMNGLEFLEEFRTLSTYKRTPVLMLTTETKAIFKQQGKVLGLTGWIIKPFNPMQLKAAIMRVLRLS